MNGGVDQAYLPLVVSDSSKKTALPYNDIDKMVLRMLATYQTTPEATKAVVHYSGSGGNSRGWGLHLGLQNNTQIKVGQVDELLKQYQHLRPSAQQLLAAMAQAAQAEQKIESLETVVTELTREVKGFDNALRSHQTTIDTLTTHTRTLDTGIASLDTRFATHPHTEFSQYNQKFNQNKKFWWAALIAGILFILIVGPLLAWALTEARTARNEQVLEDEFTTVLLNLHSDSQWPPKNIAGKNLRLQADQVLIFAGLQPELTTRDSGVRIDSYRPQKAVFVAVEYDKSPFTVSNIVSPCRVGIISLDQLTRLKSQFVRFFGPSHILLDPQRVYT